MKGSGLPQAKTDPVEMVLFLLGRGVEGETIGAGMLHWFAAVHAFVEDEECERALLLIGAVSGDFLHIEKLFGGWSNLSFSTPSTIFLAKNRKREKRKKGNHQAMKHGSKIKYAGHYFIA